MAFIEVDPKQNKVVMLLVAMLVVALLVTFVRMKKPTSVRAASGSRTETVVTRPVRLGNQPGFRPVGNPFKRPANFAAEDDAGAGPIGRMAVPSVSSGMSPVMEFPAPSGLMPPMPVIEGTHPVTPPDSEHQETPANASEWGEKPVFTLLATVGGSGHLHAVLRIGGSSERVVEVGDILEGGYEVVALDEVQALLRKGGETFVARREPLRGDSIRKDDDG